MRVLLSSILRWVRRHRLATALALGLALRLVAIDSRSLQYDDVFSIFLSERSLPEVISGTAADTMPPLYYILLHFWLQISGSVWFIRLLSILLSLAGIALLYLLAQRWSGKVAAGWAAALAAISPLSIYHAQDVRMYALLVAAQLAYLWFFTRILAAEGTGRLCLGCWAGLVLSGAAAMYSHNVAVFALAVPSIYLILRRRWSLLLRIASAQLLIGLLSLPWLLLLPGQIAKVQKAWTLPRPGIAELIQAVIMLVAALPLPMMLLGAALFLSLVILAVLAIEVWKGRKDQPGAVFWLVALLVPPAALFCASYFVKPVFIPRAFLVSSMAYDALAGLVIARTWQRPAGKILAGAFVLAAAISLPSYYTYDLHPRSPYREAVQYLEQVVRPGETIIHETKLSYFPAHFYAPNAPQVFLADPPGSPNDTFEVGSQMAMQIFPEPDLPAAVGDRSSIYFVTFSQTFREYEQMGFAEHPNIGWLDAHFQKVERKVFSDLEVYYYER